MRTVLNKRFPSLVKALASLGANFVLDGELVAFDPQGRPSFQLLQNNQSRALPVYFYAFDLLNMDGQSLLNSPIEHRRELLGEHVGRARGRYVAVGNGKAEWALSQFVHPLK